MMQVSIVAAIVVYAFWVVAKRYAPKAVRRRARALLVRTAQRLGWNRLASRFETEIHAPSAASCADGCGSCGACGSDNAARAGQQNSITPEALKLTIPR